MWHLVDRIDVATGAHVRVPQRMSNRIAVLAIHGVSPQRRYGIQDQFADALCSRLNRLAEDWGFTAPPDASGPWQATVCFPPIEPDANVAQIRPTVVRLHKQSEISVDDPVGPIIDVHEAYWSPIDKNQTTAASVATWMARNLFVPANTAARIYAAASKTCFDLGYFAAVIVLILGLTYGIIALGAGAYRHYAYMKTTITQNAASQQTPSEPAQASPVTALKLMVDPASIISSLPVRVIYSVLLSLVAAYIVVQGFVALIGLISQWRIAWSDVTQGMRRLLLSFAALFVGALLLWCAARFHLQDGSPQTVGTTALLLAGCVAALRGIMSIGQNFLVNVFGDVQIYCTHDENSKFFALRELILGATDLALARILRTDDSLGGPFYDRVFVVGHSLGSTIGMDTLLNLHTMVEEGGLPPERWRRIRGFMTLGTALEKTKYFFDAQNPTFSASYEQWRNDFYGHLFTNDFNALRVDNGPSRPTPVGIYWANYWYFTDLIANEINSYRSAVQPGQPLSSFEASPSRQLLSQKELFELGLVCQNARLGSRFVRSNPLHLWVHSDYLDDDDVWRSGLDHLQRDYHGLLEILLTG